MDYVSSTCQASHWILELCNIANKTGYGDMSQLREAVINNFRWKADHEMVVVPCSRLQTSVLQDEYIGRSIHLKGANKTILVMNKSDVSWHPPLPGYN